MNKPAKLKKEMCLEILGNGQSASCVVLLCK